MHGSRNSLDLGNPLSRNLCAKRKQ